MKIKNYNDVIKAKSNITEDDYLKAMEILHENGRTYFSSIEEVHYYLNIFNQEMIMTPHKNGADDSNGFYQNEGLYYII